MTKVCVSVWISHELSLFLMFSCVSVVFMQILDDGVGGGWGWGGCYEPLDSPWGWTEGHR